jgi:TRAP-type C4-dicarboxylate transport system permease small subunit
MGVIRLDQALDIELGTAVFGIIVIAVAGSLGMRWVQQRFWPAADADPQQGSVLKLQGSLIAVALVIGFVLAFFPTESFIDDNPEPEYYIIPKTASSQ